MTSYVALKEKFVTVAKDHVCEWCGEPIYQKCRALYRAGIFEDLFIGGWMHPECFHGGLSTWITDDPDDGFYPGMFKRGTAEER